MDCCLLTAEEVGRLEHYGIVPNHEEHIHVPIDHALRGIKDETYRLITGRNGRNYITREFTYFLRVLPSGPTRIKITQRVKSNQPAILKPVR
jgi:hypothetical protein